MAEPGCDCDYTTWAASFSRALPASPFQLAPANAETVHEVPSNVRIERRGDAWVVRDEDGSYWCGLFENCWTSTLDDTDMPALRFSTEAEARAAFAQADQMYRERGKRRKEALAKLGLADE
jgi:hypothetical protein